MSQESFGNPDFQPPEVILEAVLYCDDLEAAGAFYEKVIGLTLSSCEPDRHRFYQMKYGMLLLFRASATRSQAIEVNGRLIPKHGTTGSGHLAFAVDIESQNAMRERLARAGIKLESEIKWPSGGESIYCRDPAGNSIEFATPELWY